MMFAVATRVLLLEDDTETARSVCDGLSACGFEVSSAYDAPAALQHLKEQRFDAVILDVMVPGGSGLDVLRAMRDEDDGTPVLVLTARDSIEDRVEGLDSGADDYLVKPFAFAELLARLRALLRRPASLVEPFHCGLLQIDPLHRRASWKGRLLDLSSTEFSVLQCLAEARGDVVSRRMLLESVWGYRFDPGTNVVDVQVNRLRRRLEAVGACDLIRTIRGVGYAL